MRALLLPVALALAVAAGCGGGEGEPKSVPVPTGDQANDAALVEGYQIYVRTCVACHGLAGGGASGPRLADRVEERYPEIADQVALVTNGVPGTTMAAFGASLTPQQIEAVVRYTREVL